MSSTKPSVRALLIGGNVGLVLAAVLGVLLVSTGRLMRLADEQAIARVSLAGASARRSVELERERLRSAARLLAEQPLLAHALASHDAALLASQLARFRELDALSGCGIVLREHPWAHDGSGLPWERIAREPTSADGTFLLRSDAGAPLVLGAAAPLPTRPGAAAVAVTALDAAFASRLSQQIGLPVSILDREGALEPGRASPSARVGLRARALDAEVPAAARIEDAGVYTAVELLRSDAGVIAGIVETSLPATGVTSSLGRLVRSLLAVSALVAALAGLFSVLLGRHLVRPIEVLTEASMRIGRGDFATPIPRTYPAEIGTLAASMDEMRGRLLDLTTELKRRQALAEAVLSGIVEGVFAVDRERRLRYVNPQAAALFGKSSDEILGRFCGDVLDPRTEDGVRPCEERCPIIHARFRGSTRATEHLCLAGGATRTVVIASAPPEAGDPAEGSGPGRAGAALQFQVIRDETEIEATRRLRDTVLANISHEFRTPLSAQLASIELLRDRLSDVPGEDVRDLFLSLERGALRLTQLIDNLLESVRIETGKDSIRRGPVALDEVVEQAVDLTAPLARLREQTIDVDLPYPLLPVPGDGPRLVQVFVNLLANASKFAPAGSAIRVGGAADPREVQLWVEDEGPGLPPWAAARRFEPFLRAAAAEPEESGMGLGLFIVKSIVERHGGRLEVREGTCGDGSVLGTRMCVFLPARQGDEDPGR